MSAKRGRPRRISAEPTDRRIVTLFSESEKAKLQRLADQETDGNISEYIRLQLADSLDTV